MRKVEKSSLTKKRFEQLLKLPERSPDEYKKMVVNGRELLVPYFREIVATELEDETILAFFDTDGRRMSIGYDREGAYKYAI